MIRLLNAEEHVKSIAENADLTVFPSSFVCEKFEGIYEIKKQKLIQPQGLYNLYDDFDKDRSRRKLEEKHAIPSENSIILNVGLGELRKGFDLFLKTAEKLKNENYSFIWVGNVNDEMEQLYLNEYGDEKNIMLAGFISDKDELMSYYDACDVFMLTSREDPFPSVVLEAFNAKKPVIGFEDAGGFRDVVINGETGFLVEYGSVTELANKVRLICGDEELEQAMGDNAKLMCRKYNFHDYVRILKIYSLAGAEIRNLENGVNSQREKILYLENEVYSKNNKLSCLESQNKKLAEKNKDTVALKNKEISKLKKKNKKLTKQKNEILASSSWWITEPLRKIKYNAKKVFKLKDKVDSKIKPSNDETSKSSSSKPKA